MLRGRIPGGVWVEQVPLVAPTNPHNARYLATKRDRLGHDLPESPVES